MYSMPINSFTLINDEENNIYLAKIKSFKNENLGDDQKIYSDYLNKEKSNNKNTILKSYDILLNEKYNVVINQKQSNELKISFNDN